MTINNNDTGRPTATGAGEFKTNLPTIVSILYLVGFVVGITPIIGVIIAYLKRSDVAGSWAESHLTYLIRTFWLGLLTAVVGSILVFVPIGWLVFLWLAVWTIVRSIKSLLAAQKEQPIADPKTFLW